MNERRGEEGIGDWEKRMGILGRNRKNRRRREEYSNNI
jgi:hypothetical protein